MIKEREAQQKVQPLRQSSTGVKLIEMGDVAQEARSFCQGLYTPDAINLASTNSLFNSIPVEVKLRKADVDRLIEARSTNSIMPLMHRSPSDRSPDLGGLGFAVCH